MEILSRSIVSNSLSVDKFRTWDRNSFIAFLENKCNVQMSTAKLLYDRIREKIANETLNNNQKVAEFMSIITPIINHINIEGLEKPEYTKIDMQKIKIFVGCSNITINEFRTLNKQRFIEKLDQNACNIEAVTAGILFERIRTRTLYYDELVYSFGVKYWYSAWDVSFNYDKETLLVERPYSKNLKHEVINLFNIERWQDEMREGKENRNKKECKKHCNITTKKLQQYKIGCGVSISETHLIAVKLYCDTNKEQEEFSKTYWKINAGDSKENENDDLIKRHSKYAHWGRFLYEAVNVFGRECAYGTDDILFDEDGDIDIDNRKGIKIRRFWHGVSEIMLFPATTLIHMHHPLSTSKKFNSAKKFCQGNGMVLRLDGSSNNCFYCNWLTINDDEEEYLFIGGRNPFTICDVKLERHWNISLKIYIEELNSIVCEGMDPGFDARNQLVDNLRIKHWFVALTKTINEMLIHNPNIVNGSANDLEKYVLHKYQNKSAPETVYVEDIKKELEPKVEKKELINFNNFVMNEEYDSDAIVDDVAIGGESNITDVIVRKIIRKYIKDKYDAISYIVKLYHYFFSVHSKELKIKQTFNNLNPFELRNKIEDTVKQIIRDIPENQLSEQDIIQKVFVKLAIENSYKFRNIQQTVKSIVSSFLTSRKGAKIGYMNGLDFSENDNSNIRDKRNKLQHVHVFNYTPDGQTKFCVKCGMFFFEH
eukprot:325249_1